MAITTTTPLLSPRKTYAAIGERVSTNRQNAPAIEPGEGSAPVRRRDCRPGLQACLTVHIRQQG